MARETLLDVAIDLFGRRGFDGASTRDIAAAAGTAMSSITYHFGGKEGLYLACADYIAEQIRERQSHAFVLFHDAAALSREDARDRLLLIIDGLAAMLLHPSTANWARFIVREQLEPTEAFERLWRGAMEPLVRGAETLLARVCSPRPGRELRMMALLTFGQAMIMRAGRASLCRALEVEDIGEAEAALLRQRLRTNTIAILDAEKPE